MKPTNLVWTVEQTNSLNLVPTNHTSRSWRQLTIVRGMPGSGASTIGRNVREATDFEWIDFEEVLRGFVVGNSVSGLHIRQAHDRARQLLGIAATRRSNVILTNPFTRWWEMDSYLSTLATYSPDLMWKVKIIDLGAGYTKPRHDLMGTKYLELACRYETIAPGSEFQWLSDWASHFNETRGKKPAEGVGNPQFARRYQYDSIQAIRISMLLTWAELMARMEKACSMSAEEINQRLLVNDESVSQLALDTLKATPRTPIHESKQKVVEIMDEANIRPDLRQAVMKIWNIS